MHTNDSWARETPPDPAVTPGRANAGFFAHHGPWAPGVRLFRRLQFGAKALMISAVFALEESAAASSMNEQARDLKREVSAFQLWGHGRAMA